MQKPPTLKSPLRLAREQRQLSIETVSKKIGIHATNLSRIERGQQTPSKQTAQKLALFFEGQLTELQIIYPERYTTQLS